MARGTQERNPEEPDDTADAGAPHGGVSSRDVPYASDSVFQSLLAKLIDAILRVAHWLAIKLHLTRDDADEVASTVARGFWRKFQLQHEQGDYTDFEAMRSANNLWARLATPVRSAKSNLERGRRREMMRGAVFLNEQRAKGNPYESPQTVAEREEIRRLWEQEIPKLPEEERQVLLGRQAGDTWAQIAARLHKPVTTVRHLHRKSTARLETRFTGYEDWEPDSELGFDDDWNEGIAS